MPNKYILPRNIDMLTDCKKVAGWWERCIKSWWVKHQGSISGLCLHKFTGAVCRRPPTSEDMPLSGSYMRRRKKSKSTSRAMLTAQGSICGLSPQIHQQSSQSTVDRREVKTAAVEIFSKDDTIQKYPGNADKSTNISAVQILNFHKITQSKSIWV